MSKETRSHPIKLNLTIEPASLKKIVEQGRLMEFADALSTLAAAHIKYELVEHVTKAKVGALSISVGFDDDGEYGMWRPPKPFPPRGIWEDAMREVAIKEIVQRITR
jgi:hypothetical protein